MKKLFTIVGVLLAIGFQAMAQNVQLDAKASELKIYGTSTVHDWEIVAEQLEGKASLERNGNSLENIDQLDFVVTVKGLKSGKSGMDDNTYKALKNDKHPKITYQLTEITKMTNTSNGLVLDTKGRLSIAGVTKIVNMKVTANSASPLKIVGETTFKMTDFGIDPPTAVFGTIRTGDEITIKFNVIYK